MPKLLGQAATHQVVQLLLQQLQLGWFEHSAQLPAVRRMRSEPALDQAWVQAELQRLTPLLPAELPTLLA